MELAEKISIEITEEQNLILAEMGKIEILGDDEIQIPQKFSILDKAVAVVKQLREDLNVVEGEIINVSNLEEKKYNLELIEKIKKYTKPIKNIKAKAKQEADKQKKLVDDKFKDIVSEFTIIQKALESGNDTFDEKQREEKRKVKIAIFEEIKEQYKDYPLNLEYKEEYTKASRETIEADILAIKDAYLAEIELHKHKINTVKLQLIEQQEAYSIKNRYVFDDVERIFNLKEMTMEQIESEVEELISVQADKEFREQEEAERKAELERKQKEYEEKQAREKAEKEKREALELKNKTIELILKFNEHKKENIENMTQDTLNFILDDLQKKAVKEMEAEQTRIKKEQEEETEKKRIAAEEQAEKERLRKEAENSKSKTLLISVECIEKYTNDFKAELEEFLKSKAIVKKYAVKVKGE